jgi:hypothetical protein
MSYLGSGGSINPQIQVPTSAYYNNLQITGPTGPGVTGPQGKIGPTGPIGPIQSIGFDGGNATSVYSMGPVFDCGRAE